MKHPRLYFSGDSFSIGLKWKVGTESVDVSDADDIRVTLVRKVMAQTIAQYSKSAGTLTISTDKCVATIPSGTTANLRGLAYVLIEICIGGQWQKAVADQMINFVKPN